MLGRRSGAGGAATSDCYGCPTLTTRRSPRSVRVRRRQPPIRHRRSAHNGKRPHESGRRGVFPQRSPAPGHPASSRSRPCHRRADLRLGRLLSTAYPRGVSAETPPDDLRQKPRPRRCVRRLHDGRFDLAEIGKSRCRVLGTDPALTPCSGSRKASAAQRERRHPPRATSSNRLPSHPPTSAHL